MVSITYKGCKVHYDPKNISEESALAQAQARIEQVRRTGAKLKSFTAFTAHKGEEWYEKLRTLRGKLA